MGNYAAGRRSQAYSDSGLCTPRDPGLETPLSNEALAKLRLQQSLRAAAKAHDLAGSSTLAQVNVFFMNVPHCDVADCVNLMCKRDQGLTRRRYDWHKSVSDSLIRIEHGSAAAGARAMADTGPEARASAAAALHATIGLMTAQHLPHDAGGAARSLGNVRFFSRSVVEERYVTLPLMLGAVAPAAPTAEQCLAIGLCDVAWATLERDVSVPHSLWVYLRQTDYAWQERLDILDLPADQRAFCSAYRAGMDNEFNSKIGQFARGHHTAVVHINSPTMAHEDVADDVLAVVCDHVQALHHAGMWGRLEPARIGEVEYLESRQLSAEFVKTIGSSSCARQPPQPQPPPSLPHAAAAVSVAAAVPPAPDQLCASNSTTSVGSNGSSRRSTRTSTGLRRMEPFSQP